MNTHASFAWRVRGGYTGELPRKPDLNVVVFSFSETNKVVLLLVMQALGRLMLEAIKTIDSNSILL